MTATSPKSAKDKAIEVSMNNNNAPVKDQATDSELRNVLLIYDLAPDLSEADVKSYFEGCPQAGCIVELGPEINNFWYVFIV